MQPDLTDIQQLFSYSDQEQATFGYLQRYMRQITPHLEQILDVPATRERFMLAGLFLTYRAYNHSGLQMTTTLDESQPETIHQQRLVAFARYSKKALTTSRDYLRAIHFPVFVLKSLVLGPHMALYLFVRYGV